MRGRILGFVDQLRAHDFPVSLIEVMDAVAAVAAVGVERPRLREALAATLVKDEHDRPVFDALFEEAFPLVGRPRPQRSPRRGRSGGAGESGVPRGAGGVTGGRGIVQAPPADDSRGPGRPRSDRDEIDRREPREPHGTEEGGGAVPRARTGRHRDLLRRPFHEFTPRDLEEARDLVRELGTRLRGRLARRERRRRHGRLDVRRMLRAAVTTGGVPLQVLRRGRRPARADLVALVDLSASVATASELCLGLVAPAAAYFRRVHTFAYVDHLCPVTIEHGHLTPDGPLDLYARSDFGQVLRELLRQSGLLTRHTLLLVVGDARNNRRPPRADLLRQARDHAQRLVWLVPERRGRWNTGDSVLDRYLPACDVVLECQSLGALLSALRRTL